MKAFASCCALALAACLLAACAILPGAAQPTWEELLAEVNAEHQSIRRGEIDPTPYLRTSITEEEGLKVWDYVRAQGEDFDPDRQLTRAEAEEDSWTAAEVQDLLLEGLRFFQDGHFNINGGKPNPPKVPFFFREAAFYKTEEGGYIREDGKRVASVDGCDDLDGLFKRSISQEGELVYYPVLLKEWTMADQPQPCDEQLTVRYADGSSQTLTAEPFQRYSEEVDADNVTEYYKNGEIPVFALNMCDDAACDAADAAAIMVARAPVGMVDLRTNPGGSDLICNLWLRRYTYTERNNMYRNQYVMNVFSGPFSGADGWVENDGRVLIVLTGKRAASAAETFVDMAHNVENVLFIGENTSGAQVTSAAYHIQLPHSKCVVTMGHGLFVVPQDWDYYEELRGYEPDIWVPAAEAEELAVKLMEHLGAVGAPQE